MIFSSLIFLYLFMPICLVAYNVIKPIKAKNAVLIILSLAFYAWGEPTRVIFLILSAVVNYFVGIGIGAAKQEKYQKLCLTGGLIFNIGMIAVFKYSGFIMTNINSIFSADLPVPEIVQMAGISFYTFQVISYIVDCYWGKIKPQKNFFKLLLYVCLFPQLIAGPIVRYETIAAEIDDRKTTLEDFSQGLTRFVVGLAKKVLLADQLFRIVEDMLGGSVNSLTIFGSWYGVILYSLYIYFDFSGYSDIAIGLGRIFGFHFNENFDHPYLCKDITEFWQRWHISLGSFFRDYLLPVTFFGKRNKYLSLFLVWLCTGIWHGANWNYIIWGLYYGLFILLETRIGKKNMNKIPIVIRHIYSKLVIIIGFGIFYFEDIGALGTFLKNLTPFNENGWGGAFELSSLCGNLYLIIIAIVCTFPLMKAFGKLSEKNDTARSVISVSGTILCMGMLALSSIMLVDTTTNAFLYWRF
ncbi:MAG: MBOAT family protein [Oscillospiraceae bacterium]|nr:MBOAT family protein [Oscillospiraceae bacterium]